MSKETAHEREVRLGREFKQANRAEFPLSSYKKPVLQSRWLETRRDEVGAEPKRGNAILDLDRYGSLEAAEEALGLRPKPEPVSHRNVVEATTAIFRELPPRDAKVLVHYYEDQWTYQQVADELGIVRQVATRTIKRALNHARKVADGLGITQLWVHGKLVNLPAVEEDAITPEALEAEDDTQNTRVRQYHGPLRGADMTSVRVKQLDGTYRHETCAKLGEGPLNGPSIPFTQTESEWSGKRLTWYYRTKPDPASPTVTRQCPCALCKYRVIWADVLERQQRERRGRFMTFDVRVEFGIPFHAMFERGLVQPLTKAMRFWRTEGHYDRDKREARERIANRGGH